jgi:hypothetical protein
MHDDTLPRNQWPLAIVTDVFASSDNRVRKVQIRCGRSGSSYVRPITQLCRLIEIQ